MSYYWYYQDTTFLGEVKKITEINTKKQVDDYMNFIYDNFNQNIIDKNDKSDDYFYFDDEINNYNKDWINSYIHKTAIEIPSHIKKEDIKKYFKDDQNNILDEWIRIKYKHLIENLTFLNFHKIKLDTGKEQANELSKRLINSFFQIGNAFILISFLNHYVRILYNEA